MSVRDDVYPIDSDLVCDGVFVIMIMIMSAMVPMLMMMIMVGIM